MYWFLLALTVLPCSGLLAVISCRKERLASLLGSGGAFFSCVAGAVAAVSVLVRGRTLTFDAHWSIMFGAFHLKIDGLAAFFLIPIFVLCALAAVYGYEYLKHHEGGKNIGYVWFNFNMLIAAMALVVASHNALLFLVSWELMTLFSFFLVMFESRQESTRRAGFLYLIATHLGLACLLAVFIFLGSKSGSLDFDSFGSLQLSRRAADLLFFLGLIGFGTKAGFIPLHVWLPEAHPAAPSHVSAVMSGVMIKTGIYGFVRLLIFLPTPSVTWAVVLILVGASSGVIGVLMALSQHDLKRLLAYHSVENIGIITLGVGVGVLGLALGIPSLVVLGFAGGLLHIINHALFKGLLFMAAGAVICRVHTRDIEDLGGLLKSMPWTGCAFLVGSAAICGLPPLNGFVSEFLIYNAAFGNLTGSTLLPFLPLLLTITSLALIGGLASTCFAKAFGIVFLGEPRNSHMLDAKEVGFPMRFAMIVLALACAAMAFASPWILPYISLPLAEVTKFPVVAVNRQLSEICHVLQYVVIIGALLVAMVAVVALLRRMLLVNKTIEKSVTWGCGYIRPNARMQYTASSFAKFFTDWFSPILQNTEDIEKVEGYFPQGASLKTEAPDVYYHGFFKPVFAALACLLMKVRYIQSGRLHAYLFYIVLVLTVLLLLYMGGIL